MQPTDEVLRLLQEIRDTAREHLAEYKRISDQLMELHRTTSERAEEQYRRAVDESKASAKVFNALWWAVTVLIAVCFGSLLIIYWRISELHPGP
jgi:hypothetical protein